MDHRINSQYNGQPPARMDPRTPGNNGFPVPPSGGVSGSNIDPWSNAASILNPPFIPSKGSDGLSALRALHLHDNPASLSHPDPSFGSSMSPVLSSSTVGSSTIGLGGGLGHISGSPILGGRIPSATASPISRGAGGGSSRFPNPISSRNVSPSSSPFMPIDSPPVLGYSNTLLPLRSDVPGTPVQEPTNVESPFCGSASGKGRYATVGSLLTTNPADPSLGTGSRHELESRSPWDGQSRAPGSGIFGESLFSIPVNQSNDKSQVWKLEGYGNHPEDGSVLLSGSTSIHSDIHSVRPPTPESIKSASSQPDTGSRSLWIGNFDPSFTESDVHSLFAVYGKIESIRVLPEKECAFVNFVHSDDAAAAMRGMQGGRVGNCIIKIGFGRSENSVAVSSPAPSNPVPQQPSGTSVADGGKPSRSLWVGNLASSVRIADLLNLFERFGKVESSRLLSSKNCGFINYATLNEAAYAKGQANGYILEGLAIKVGFAKCVVDECTQYHVQGGENGVEYGAVPDDLANEGKHIDQSVEFISEIPALEHLKHSDKHHHTIDPGSLREMKRKLEHNSTLSVRDVDSMFNELLPQIVQLATDGFGNTVVQRLIERISDTQRLRLIEKCESQLSSIGVHKNGTWVVQKMLEHAKTSNQVNLLVRSLKPYIPALIMDPFGNYVVQGCLHLGATRDQFIFDAMFVRCLDICQGKFGARAMRACLESPSTTKKQQRLIASAVIKHALFLITNQNGILLIHWLVDNSDLSGRYGILIRKLLHKVSFLCCQKLANVVMLKVVAQTLEPEARRILVHDCVFKSDDSVAAVLTCTFTSNGDIPASPSFSYNSQLSEFGASLLYRCIVTEKDDRQKENMKSTIRRVSGKLLSSVGGAAAGTINRSQAYRKLVDEVGAR